MKRTPFNEDWTFSVRRRPGPPGEGGIPVTLPHDFTICSDVSPEAPGGSSTGYYGGGIGAYTKLFDAPADPEKERVLLSFDGVYMNAEVNINGAVAALQAVNYVEGR